MLETLMKEVNIPHLTGKMLPEFRWRVSLLGTMTGQRLFVSDIELVKRQGLFLIGVEAMERDDWLKTLGQKVAEKMEQDGVFDMIGHLVRHYYGDHIYDTAMTLRKDIGLTQNYWMLRLKDGDIVWITALPNGYRLPTPDERAEIRMTLTLLTNSKEKTSRESPRIAV